MVLESGSAVENETAEVVGAAELSESGVEGVGYSGCLRECLPDSNWACCPRSDWAWRMSSWTCCRLASAPARCAMSVMFLHVSVFRS